MSCPSNLKKLWIFEFEGPCDYQMTYIKAAGWKGDYHVTRQCSRCHHKDQELFVNGKRLIRMGFDAKKLSEMSFFDTFGKSPDELRRES